MRNYFFASKSRMQSPSRKPHIPRCHEYCEGNLAEYYCPECTAMFCDSCYNREHHGNERKAQHGKLTELRSVCAAHKHTLDYFNLTLLQPMCVICKKEVTQTPELAHHVIDSIDAMVPRLKSLIRKKLDTATALIDRLNQEVDSVELAAKSTTDAAVGYVQCCFGTLRTFLDEREGELIKRAKNYFEEFLEVSDERVEVKNTVQNLEAIIAEGELLLKKQSRSLVVEFPVLFTRLKELCSVTTSERQLKRLKIMVEFEKSIAEQLRRVGTVSSCSTLLVGQKTEENQTTEDSVETTCINCSDETTSPDHDKGEKRPFIEPESSPCAKQARMSDTTGNKAATNKPKRQVSVMSPGSPLRESCRATRSPQGYSADRKISTLESSPSNRVRRGGELSKEINKCDMILTELWAQDDSCPFSRPVDRKQFPEYYELIIQPMDLSVIKEKLHSVRYASAVDFVRDVRLMFNNCRTYNEKGSFVFEAGEQLEQIFNHLLKKNFPNFEDVFLNDCEESCDE